MPVLRDSVGGGGWAVSSGIGTGPSGVLRPCRYALIA